MRQLQASGVLTAEQKIVFFLGREMGTARKAVIQKGILMRPQKKNKTPVKNKHALFEIYHFLVRTCTNLADVNRYFQKFLFFV